MGFNLMSALGGAATAYTKAANKKRDEVSKMMQTGLAHTLETGTANRKSRQEEINKQNKLAKQLQALGLDKDQTLGVLNSGTDQAEYFLKTAPVVANARNVAVSDFVEMVNPAKTDLSLRDGIENIVGVFDTTNMQSNVPEFSRGTEFLVGKPAEQIAATKREELGTAFGVDMGNIEAAARGKRVYGDAPMIKYDPALYEADALALRKGMADVTVAEATAEGIDDKIQSDLDAAAASIASDTAMTAYRNAQAALAKAETGSAGEIAEAELDKLKAQAEQARAAAAYSTARASAEGAVDTEVTPSLVNSFSSIYRNGLTSHLSRALGTTNGLAFVDQGNGISMPMWEGSPEARGAYDAAVQEYNQNFATYMGGEFGSLPETDIVLNAYGIAPETMPTNEPINLPILQDGQTFEDLKEQLVIGQVYRMRDSNKLVRSAIVNGQRVLVPVE